MKKGTITISPKSKGTITFTQRHQINVPGYDADRLIVGLNKPTMTNPRSLKTPTMPITNSKMKTQSVPTFSQKNGIALSQTPKINGMKV